MPFDPKSHRPPSLHLYDLMLSTVRKIYIQRDYQYGEAWRFLRLTTLSDEILQKVHRLRQMEDHMASGEPLIEFAPDIENCLEDIVNWAILEMIRYHEMELQHVTPAPEQISLTNTGPQGKLKTTNAAS